MMAANVQFKFVITNPSTWYFFNWKWYRYMYEAIYWVRYFKCVLMATQAFNVILLNV